MWNKVHLNKLNIESEFDKSVLIKCPNKSKYAGWKFFHPIKLIRVEGHKGYLISMSFPDSWTFRLFRGKGEYKRTVELSSEEMKEVFSNNQFDINDESYLIVEEPIKIDEDVEIRKELLK